jgi:biotin carboxylase
MAEPAQERIPVILLDTIGYSFYASEDGRKFLPPDRYAVRLVTDVAKAAQAVGDEIESVVAVHKKDEHALADAVRFQAGYRGRPAARLVAVTERMLLPAAALREELGIPGATVAQTLPFRDKVIMKEQLSACGVRVPEFAPFSESAAMELFRTHPKLVAKPRRGAGSIGVYIIDDRQDLAAFMRAEAGRLADFEIEEFIPGQLCLVDSVVTDSKVVAAVASRYLDDTTAYLRLDPCRDVGIGQGDLHERLMDFNQQVLSCFPGFSGVTHHEMFVTDTGIWFCEIAARAGGGGVIAAFKSRTGINLDEAAVQAQLTGTVPVPEPADDHLTGWAIMYSRPGVVAEPVSPPSVPWLLETQILVKQGDRLSAPGNNNDGVAIVTVRGDTEAEVIARIAEASALVTPKLAPASGP